MAQNIESESLDMQIPIGHQFRGDPFVTLLVGPEELVYHVHQSILCNNSKVFKATFCGEFRESSNRSMSLPDDNIEAVERMIQWLYSAKLGLTSSISAEASGGFHWQLANLNTLADKYDILRLKNKIIDELYEAKTRLTKPPPFTVITYVYDNTTEHFSYRKLMVDWYVWHIDMEWYGKPNTRALLSGVPDFVIDVALAFGAKMNHPARKPAFSGDKISFTRSPPNPLAMVTDSWVPTASLMTSSVPIWMGTQTTSFTEPGLPNSRSDLPLSLMDDSRLHVGWLV